VVPQEARGVVRAATRILRIIDRFRVEGIDVLVYELCRLAQEETSIVEGRA